MKATVDEPPPWALKLFNELTSTLKDEMTTLRNDLELRMTNLEKRMTELETNMRYITALTSFDAPPETHPHHLRRASTNIDNHFPPAGAATRVEIDATGLSARVAAIELLVAAAGSGWPGP
jgi:hypothetical protein